ncbi:serine/threonine-protein kinase [Lactonifactor longoviformis]|uniref:serine/threonine-protein kinase n=1 Tax=Lactonifactor longoviformis TaxID=341220 RepID=UPI00299F6F10|nr:serine/threonine-protein kinase [Lactonifactor longoviformis]
MQLIGKGGMGKVYLAYDLRLEKNWAVKEIESGRGGVLRERDVLKKMKHPALPGIVDIIEERGYTYLVMDYIWGINLKELCRAKKKIPGKTILRWGIELCDVLDYLHNQKPPVIYRDLKPENLIIGKKGKLFLVDFGIALIRDRHSAEERLGTAGYAAPEQYRGRAAVQSDIYGLGMVLKELVKCGRYQGEDLCALEQIIEKCTRRNVMERYQSVRTVKHRLTRLLYRKRQTGLLSAAGAVFVMAGCLLLFQQEINIQKQEETYQEALETGARQEKDAAQAYEQAVKMKPEKEEVYLALLNTYIARGETKAGIQRIRELAERYEKRLPREHKLWTEIGRLYFRGSIRDPYFSVNYKKAEEYFSMDPKDSREKRSYLNLCRIFSCYSDEIPWEEAGKALEYLRGLLGEEENPLVKAQECMTLCGVYFSYEEELGEYLEDPWQQGIALAEEGAESLEHCRDHILYPVYARELCLLTGKAYEYRGIWNEANAQYDKTLAYPMSEKEQVKIRLMTAWNCRMEGDCEKAGGIYERLLQDFPEEAEPYCAYSLMALMEEKDREKAEEILDRGKEVRGIRENYSYKLLTERLKESGERKEPQE